MTITTHPTKNCNVIYLDNLQYYGGRPQAALLSCFTNKIPQYYYPDKQERTPGPPTYTQYNCGILLFALGSEHRKMKYAHNLADYIREHELGKVFEMPEAPNPLHNNKTGILFVWIPEWAALREWWEGMPMEDKIRASKNQL